MFVEASYIKNSGSFLKDGYYAQNMKINNLFKFSAMTRKLII